MCWAVGCKYICFKSCWKVRAKILLRHPVLSSNEALLLYTQDVNVVLLTLTLVWKKISYFSHILFNGNPQIVQVLYELCQSKKKKMARTIRIELVRTCKMLYGRESVTHKLCVPIRFSGGQEVPMRFAVTFFYMWLPHFWFDFVNMAD